MSTSEKEVGSPPDKANIMDRIPIQTRVILEMQDGGSGSQHHVDKQLDIYKFCVCLGQWGKLFLKICCELLNSSWKIAHIHTNCCYIISRTS